MLGIPDPKVFEDQISSAIASHSRWKAEIAVAIETGRSEWTPDIVAGCGWCNFGTWLESVPDELRDAAFENVYRVHQEFHLKAADMLRLALAGDKDLARDGIARGSPYARVSTELISALVAWRLRNKDKFKATESRI